MPSSSIAVQDLKVGMFVRLELGWMSHPFPLSSFRIASLEQIATIRGLGLERVIWVPEKSDPPDDDDRTGGDEITVEQVPTEAEKAAARRREQLGRQRDSQRHCEAQYDEASTAMQRVNSLLDIDPPEAARCARHLARSMLDKMLVDGELCIRLLSSQAGDRHTAHALNVTVISMLMARTLAMPDDELLDLGTGALLHDIGKLDLPLRVHHVDDSFTSAEMRAYRDHVALGVARGRRMALGGGALQVLAQHHEMADGTGFPGRVSLDAIGTAARLVSLVNRYDNLCNPGPRGTALTPHEAISVLFAQSRGKFDMPVLTAFIRMMGVYPAGSVVQLTDDRHAMVVQVNSSRPLKPRVLVYDARTPRDEALLIDLEQMPDLGIRRSVSPSKLPGPALAYLAPRPRVSYYFDTLAAPVKDADVEVAEERE